MPEQQNIEYKQSWHDDYLKWVCGFANATYCTTYYTTYFTTYCTTNESAVGDHIKALKEKGAIKRDGSTRGKWVILINI